MEFIFPNEYDENFQERFFKERFVNKIKDGVIFFSSSNNKNSKIKSMQFKFLDSLSDEYIIKFFKNEIYKTSSELAGYEFNNYEIFIYVPSISINNSSESTQKYLWFKNKGSIGIISDEQNFMIDFL
jgi:hypothetical protein